MDAMLLKVPEVVACLGVSRAKVYELMASGDLVGAGRRIAPYPRMRSGEVRDRFGRKLAQGRACRAAPFQVALVRELGTSHEEQSAATAVAIPRTAPRTDAQRVSAALEN